MTALCGSTGVVIACDKREAFAQGSEATKQSILSLGGEMDCFASLAMTVTVTASMTLEIIERLAAGLAAPQRLAGGRAEFGKHFSIL